jgi:hypothetical protein
MKPLFILLLLTFFIFQSCAEQKNGCRPQKKVRMIKFRGFMSIRATVDFIKKENDSTTVILLSRRQKGWQA